MKSAIRSHASLSSLLQRAGLDDKEAAVYLALLSLHAGRVTAIARTAGQSRSHTYLVLKSLEEKGLVSHVESGKVIQFIAESPKRLLQYVQDHEQQWKQTAMLLESALPHLQSIVPESVGQPRVTTLHGIDGTKQVYRDVLSQPFCAFFNAEMMFNAFDQNVIPLLFGKDAKLRGRELFVDNPGARRYLKEIPQDDEYEVRLLPKHVQFSSECVFFGDTVALFAYDEEFTIIRIQNKRLADSFRAWFEGLWKISTVTRKR